MYSTSDSYFGKPRPNPNCDSNLSGESSVDRALADLARICEQERRSAWPSIDPWRNADAWQDAYIALATRIQDGRVDIDRPLGPLARKTARNFFLSECRRQRRFSSLSDVQLQRYLGEGPSLEEQAEASRRGDALRVTMLRLCADGELDARDVGVLIGRYAEERPAAEVGASLGIGTANVRQLCARRCKLLREALRRQGLEPGEASC